MRDSLLQRVADGEQSAMQACIDRFGPLVWSLARRLSATASDAEDAVQEIFIALWEHAGRFDPEKGSETTFVATIARRRLIDRTRKHMRDQQRVENVATTLTPPETQEPSAEMSDDVRAAAAAFNELSADQREVLGLAIHRGCTHEQIAKITSMPLGTVKTHCRRGLMRVRDLLAGQSDTSNPREVPS